MKGPQGCSTVTNDSVPWPPGAAYLPKADAPHERGIAGPEGTIILDVSDQAQPVRAIPQPIRWSTFQRFGGAPELYAFTRPLQFGLVPQSGALALTSEDEFVGEPSNQPGGSSMRPLSLGQRRRVLQVASYSTLPDTVEPGN